MYFNFNSKKISGVISILPENTYKMEDEVINPEDTKSIRLKKIIGYGTRRRAKGTTTLSDLLLVGAKKIINEKKIKKEDIGGIIVCTLSQDYIEPSISCIIQGELNLPNDVLCIDMPQACAGFVVGLIHSFLYLDQMQNKKILLCTGEVFNRKSMENEPKFEHPQFGGDIANITIVENSLSNSEINCSYFNDGVNRNALLIKHGAFRHPMTSDIISKRTTNIPCTGVIMDGSSVFNFVQKELPPALKDIINRSGHMVDDIDYFLFHQPNKFMLQKLASSLKVPFEKVPMELTSNLGNSDSGTIPAVMSTYLSDILLTEKHLYCISGFGAGLTWASIVMENDKLEFCENIISNL